MKIAIIGTGFMADFHARAIQSLGHKIVGVADRDEKRASEFAATYGCR